MNDGREHLRALLAAYTEATGLALTLSPERARVLREMDRRGFTPADVRAVMGGIKAHIARGTHGYTDASLDWRNAMRHVDTFEERVQKCRQAAVRKAGARRAQAAAAPRAETVPTPDGGTVTRIEPPRATVPEVPRVGPNLTDLVLAKLREGQGG